MKTTVRDNEFLVRRGYDKLAERRIRSQPIYGLHVWVHEDNPDGVFAPRNPDFEDMPGCIGISDPK